jgi:hypothetical protein
MTLRMNPLGFQLGVSGLACGRSPALADFGQILLEFLPAGRRHAASGRALMAPHQSGSPFPAIEAAGRRMRAVR